MNNRLFTEDEIVEGIKANRHEVFEQLYRRLTKIIYSEVMRNSGSKEDAQDHFQDAITVVAFNVKTGKYKSQGKFEGYFINVAKKLWLKKLRVKNQLIETGFEEGIEIEDDFNEDRILDLIKYDQQLDRVYESLKQLEDICRTILTKHYFQKMALKDLAKELGWDYSRVKKRNFLCKQKLKKLMLKGGK
jgi:RNA polymerase sigma factor (sigma-70 family)